MSSLLLAAQSPVFRAMFKSAMQEGKEKEISIGVESTADAQLHRAMIQFMYSAELPKPSAWAELMQLLFLADKFEVAKLIEACAQSMSTQMTQLRALDIFRLHDTDMALPEAFSALTNKATSALLEKFKVPAAHGLSELKFSSGVGAVVEQEGFFGFAAERGARNLFKASVTLLLLRVLDRCLV